MCLGEILGYSDTAKAIRTHVDNEDKGVTKCDTLGGQQELTVINESGLYNRTKFVCLALKVANLSALTS